jgi:NAD-dependent dihydropyrimidine dehydrogenase PreA subunit
MSAQARATDQKSPTLEMLCQFAPGDRGQFIRVVADRCTACGNCAKFCVRDVWSRTGDIYEPTNLDDCIECGACWNGCPEDAIEYSEPPGGTGVRFSYG